MANWIGAVLFAYEAYQVTQKSEDYLREAALSANIFQYLKNKVSLTTRKPREVNILDFLQYDFYNNMHQLMHINYMRFWELFKPGQRFARKEFDQSKHRLQNHIIDKRVRHLRDQLKLTTPLTNHSFIGLILDSSGSMKKSDPHGMRKKAAGSIIELLDKQTAVFLVDFDNQARWLNPREWKDYSTAELIKALSKIDANGGTEIGEGLNKMQKILQENQTHASNGAVLLLSDGKSNYHDEARWFADHQIPIYTVSYKGIGNGQLLSSIAAQTGGHYIKAFDESDVLTAFEDFHYQLKGYSPLLKFVGRIKQDEVKSVPFHSDYGAQTMSVTTSWLGSKIAVKLISPGGKPYTRSGQKAQWNMGENYITTRIDNPTPGEWKAELTGVEIPSGGEPFTFRVNEDTPNQIKLDIEKSHTGNIHLKILEPDKRIRLKDLAPDIHIITPTQRRIDISSNFRDKRVSYLPSEGTGSYKFQVRFKARTSQGKYLQRHFERSVYIGDSTVTNAARVLRVTGNYLRSPLGTNTGNQVGIQCTIYDQDDSNHAKAKGIVTYVAPNWCNIEIQRYLEGAYQIRAGDIIRLNPDQWQSD